MGTAAGSCYGSFWIVGHGDVISCSTLACCPADGNASLESTGYCSSSAATTSADALGEDGAGILF